MGDVKNAYKSSCQPLVKLVNLVNPVTVCIYCMHTTLSRFSWTGESHTAQPAGNKVHESLTVSVGSKLIAHTKPSAPID